MTVFWRAFLLIALLNVAGVLATFQVYRAYEREPRARALAQQAISVVNLTRAALVSADPFRRRDLLIELNESEGLRVYPATASEQLIPFSEDGFLGLVAQRVRQSLGPETRLARQRDGVQGLWVSFFIDSDEFWLVLPRERMQSRFGLQWLGWGIALLAVALAGAWLIASGIARPLRNLTRATQRLGRGQTHEPVPEEGPREIASLASGFNRMATDMESMERERAMVLAGISHDLRTPLSRLRLALEMSGADAGSAQAMSADIEEMDAIIGQFLDFARGTTEERQPNDLVEVLDDLAGHYARLGKQVAFQHPESLPTFAFARMSVRRAISNLIDNALRYAGEPIEVRTTAEKGAVTIDVLDQGPGIPPREVERLKRPFTRLEASRSGPGGAGLGLAIVERVARLHGGSLDLLPRDGGGLLARLRLHP